MHSITTLKNTKPSVVNSEEYREIKLMETIENGIAQGGTRAQWLRECVDLTEDTGSVLRIHVRQFTTASNIHSKG